jgi:hypothetical protein
MAPQEHNMGSTGRAIVTLALIVLVSGHRPSAVADNWIEIASPNFTVISNAGDGAARNVAWQFEQIRAAITEGWQWARADLDRPFLVIAVKDESSMRAMAPEYWETRGRVTGATRSWCSRTPSTGGCRSGSAGD